MEFTRLSTHLMRCFAAMGMVLLAATGAQAQDKSIVEKFSPATVGAALTKYGLKFEQQRDRSGDPLMIVKPGALVHQSGVAIIFYGCDEDDACDTFTFYTYFKTKEPLEEDVYHVWNDIFRVRTWTKAFKDTDGDTGLVLNVNAVGGVGLPSLEFLLGVFLTEINVFREALEGAPQGGVSANLKDTGRWAAAFDKVGTSANGGAELDAKTPPKDLMGQ